MQPPPRSIDKAGQVRDIVIQHICEIGGFSRPTVTESDRLDSELRMKSIVFVEVQVAIEEDLEVEIDPLHVLDLNRLDRIIEYVEGLVRVPKAQN